MSHQRNRRRITIDLTGPQYSVLAHAVAYASNVWEQDKSGPTSQSVLVLDRTWEQIREAWESGHRPPRSQNP